MPSESLISILAKKIDSFEGTGRYLLKEVRFMLKYMVFSYGVAFTCPQR